MPRERPPLPQEGIYRAILWVMVATIVLGVVLAIAGETVYADPALSRLGGITALVGAAIYVFFRWLGAREMRRRGQPPDDDGAGR